MQKIDTIKKIDIKLIVSKETNLFFNKNTLSYCPFCNSGNGKQKSSAFQINTQKNTFKCFSCEKTGDAINFIEYLKNFDTKQAIDYLAEKYTSAPERTKEPELKTDLSKTIYAIKKNSIAKATEYLNSRKVETDKLPKESYFYNSIENAVVFFDSDNQLINNRFITPENNLKVKMTKGSKLQNALYSKTYKTNSEIVYIVEGVINALSFFPISSLAIFTTGNKFTDKEKLSKYLKNKRVVLSFDNDKAGNECKKYYIDFILNNIEIKSLQSLQVPENKDINDLKQENELTKYLENSKNFEDVYIDILEKKIQNTNAKDKAIFLKEFDFYAKNSCYYTEQVIKKTAAEKRISNFLMESLYNFTNGTNNSKRLIKLQKINEKPFTIEVLSSEMKLDTFDTILKSHAASFKGTSYDLKSIWEYLMQNEITAKEISTIGYVPEFDIYAFENGIISNKNDFKQTNNIGIIKDNENILYLPNHAAKGTFDYFDSKIDFETWSKFVYNTFDINGGIGIMYSILSIFRDIVFNEIRYFPFVHLFGDYGVGKTAFALTFLKLFSNDLGTDLNSTSTAGLSRETDQRQNSLFYYKEFTNEVSTLIEGFVLSAYDGAGGAKGMKTTGNEINKKMPKSGIVFDGNHLPVRNPAVFSRLIVLMFEHQDFSDRQRTDFSKLEKINENGNMNILKEIHKYRNEFKKEFPAAISKLREQIKKNADIQHLETRLQDHLALLLAPYQILSKYLKFPFAIKELSKKLIEYANQKHDLLNQIKATTIFFQSLEYGRTQIESKKDANNEKYYLLEKDILYIKYETAYTYYNEFCRKNNLQATERTTLRALLMSKTNKSFVKGNRDTGATNKTGFGYSFMFRYTKTENGIMLNKTEINI